MRYGYIQDAISDDHYTLGALAKTVLQPSGQWYAYLPENEVQQKNGVESMNCTVYGTLNALEVLARKRDGKAPNYSERYGGVMAGTTQDGNSPHTVIEVIRNYAGVIPDSVLPFDDKVDTWQKSYSGVTFGHKLSGLSWLKKNDVRHEWVLNGDTPDWQNILKECLRYSPIGIAVQAWSMENGMFVRRGMDTHWCLLVGYMDKKYWIVYDSYDKHLKKLDWNYNFYRAKRYAIAPRVSFDMKFITRAIQGLFGAY